MTIHTSEYSGMKASETVESVAPVQHHTRERSDTYAGEIFRSGEWRVAVCRDGIQMLVQRRRNSTREPATAVWDSVAFCTTRAALLRLWRALTHQDGADLLALLPERITRSKRTGSPPISEVASSATSEASHG